MDQFQFQNIIQSDTFLNLYKAYLNSRLNTSLTYYGTSPMRWEGFIQVDYDGTQQKYHLPWIVQINVLGNEPPPPFITVHSIPSSKHFMLESGPITQIRLEGASDRYLRTFKFMTQFQTYTSRKIQQAKFYVIMPNSGFDVTMRAFPFLPDPGDPITRDFLPSRAY